MEVLLTVSQTVGRLSISRPKLYDLIRRGEIRSLTIGRARRIPESEIERYIAQGLEKQAVAS